MPVSTPTRNKKQNVTFQTGSAVISVQHTFKVLQSVIVDYVEAAQELDLLPPVDALLQLLRDFIQRRPRLHDTAVNVVYRLAVRRNERPDQTSPFLPQLLALKR